MATSQEIRRLESEGFAGAPDNGLPLSDMFGFLGLASHSKKIPGWWTPERDKALRRFYRESDHLSGAIHAMVSKMVAIPLHIYPRNPHIAAHHRLAQAYEDDLMNLSGVMQGWKTEYAKFILDYQTQDNGSFFGIMAPGDKSTPLAPGERPSGVIHLDAGEVTRTGGFVYPIWYTHPRTGKTYKIHRGRTMFMSSLTAAEERAYGVGFCAVSRAFDSVQTLIDIARYKQEKLGSRPLRGILTINGMGYQQVKDMLKDWRIENNKQGLKRFAHMLLLAQQSGNLDVNITELSGIPDGFSERDSTTLAMYTIALAMGVDVRELWPGEFGASKATTETEHVKARSKTPGLIMSSVEHMLNMFYLPSTLYAKFDYTDDFIDQLTAQIRFQRARQRKLELDSGAMNSRAVRVDALNAGDIDQDTFDLMELADLRIPSSGDSVELLFWSRDPDISRFLELGQTVDPYNLPTDEDEAQRLMDDINAKKAVNNALLINSNSSSQRLKLRKANAALEWMMRKVDPARQVTVTIDSVELTNTDRDSEIEAQTGPNPIDPNTVSVEESQQGQFNDTGPSVNRDLTLNKELSSIDAVIQGYEDYKSELEVIFYNYYFANISKEQFIEQLDTVVQAAIDSAISNGLAAGVTKEGGDDANTVSELRAAELRLARERYEDLSQSIVDTSNAVALETKIELWANGYIRVNSLARARLNERVKLIWVRDPAKESCTDCIRYDGMVFYSDQWAAAGAIPQSRGLACGGWRCGCTLQDTNLPLTPGSPPSPTGERQ